MTNTDNSQIPTRNGTAASINTSTTGTTPISHVPFHPDDYTHPCHPLYVHPSDLLASSLVSELFDGTCYGSWRRSILIALSIRNKLDFIHGTTKKPPEGSPLLRQWQRCNDLVVAWLANSVTKEIHRYAVSLLRIFGGNYKLGMVRLMVLGGGSKFAPKVQFDPQKASLYCKYCKRTGHVIEKCHRLHGYPSNFKFTKGSGSNFGPRKVAAKAACESYPTDSSTSSVPFNESTQMTVPDQTYEGSGLTKDEHSQLQLLLHKTHISPGSSHSLMASAHFAGKVATHSVLLKLCLFSKVDSSVWIIDSGASDHMTSKLSLLFNIKPFSIPCLISLPNGYKVKVTNTGPLNLFPNFTLHNVLYVPTFQYNLISVYQLVSQFDGIAHFTKNLCLFQDHSQKKPLILGRLDNGLYELAIPPLSAAATTSVPSHPLSVKPVVCNAPVFYTVLADDFNSAVLSKTSVCSSVNINKMDVVWHFRLGHIPFYRMKTIPAINSSLSSTQSFPCSICPLARQTRLSFPSSDIHSTAIFQLIHVDTWGPYHTSTTSNARYFLTIVDDYSRCTWTHLMGAKNNAFDLLKAFIAMVDTQFH
ncbi:uncharacterized protein LOC132617483 [Lycium barbarum]|uniref:uncharacterized protein LOC132617483 n=1 Tax=Lycium barbarum TaxID=112863 RepID=UPI00293F04EE|nr:uncharacterized protein LOC132617483 [Lycium barbarum]